MLPADVVRSHYSWHAVALARVATVSMLTQGGIRPGPREARRRALPVGRTAGRLGTRWLASGDTILTWTTVGMVAVD